MADGSSPAAFHRGLDRNCPELRCRNGAQSTLELADSRSGCTEYDDIVSLLHRGFRSFHPDVTNVGCYKRHCPKLEI